MRHLSRVAALLALASTPLAAQANGSAPAAAPASAPVVLTAEQQIASAVLPAPKEFRDSATVLGYAPDGRFVTLRAGHGPFVCLASDPKRNDFHVACYHRSLEPFMARGRALRAQGITGPKVDTVRFAEARNGRLKLPTRPALLYTLTAPAGSYDAATGTLNGARPLFVVYMPYATAASTGLSAVPAEGTPWIMFPGTPKAHIMFVPRM